jgi:hypothetical protein
MTAVGLYRCCAHCRQTPEHERHSHKTPCQFAGMRCSTGGTRVDKTPPKREQDDEPWL